MKIRYALLILFVMSHVLVLGQLTSVSVIADQTNICQGDSTHLHVLIETIGTPTLDVKWIPENLISSNVDDSPCVNPVSSTTYTVTVTDVHNQKSLSASIRIAVIPRPIIVAPEDDSICMNEKLHLSPLRFDNALGPFWSHNGEGTIIYSSDSLNVDYCPGENETGQIMFVLHSDAIDFCSNVSDTTFVNYVDRPKALVTANKLTVCANDALQIEGSIINADSFKWSHNGSGELLFEKTLKPIYVPNANEFGDVEVQLTAIGLACNDVDVLSFKVGLEPNVVLPENDSVCSNEPIDVSPLKYENVQKPIWGFVGQGRLELSSDSLAATYIPDADEIGEVLITLNASSKDNCGWVADTVSLFYVPKTRSNILTSDTIICGNSFLDIVGDVENARSFVWINKGKGELNGENSLTPRYTPAIDENGTIEIILKSFGSFCNHSDTIKVRISSLQVEFNHSVQACEGEKVLLSIVMAPSFQCLWNTGQSGNQIIVDALFDELYQATITNEDMCSAEAVISLSVTERPVVALSADYENKILTVAPIGMERYDFVDDNNNLLYSGISNVFDYSSVPFDAKFIRVIVYDDLGCASDSEPPGNTNTFELANTNKVNAFSPNNDGINDRLLPGQKIVVFDRSDKVLYEGTDGWDGSYNGKALPTGTYFYVLYNGNNIEFKSAVTLLR